MKRRSVKYFKNKKLRYWRQKVHYAVEGYMLAQIKMKQVQFSGQDVSSFFNDPSNVGIDYGVTSKNIKGVTYHISNIDPLNK